MQSSITHIIDQYAHRTPENCRGTYRWYAQSYDAWIQGPFSLDDEDLKGRAASFLDQCPRVAAAILRCHHRTGDVSEVHVEAVEEAAEIARARRVGFFVA